MKKNRSLRSMIFFLAVVLIIPILCFTLYLQVQTWRTMKHNLQRELEGELNTANHTLEMVIDKYDMVLYDFCTNDEIIELVEQINESEKPSDAVKYQIRRSLAHICNRNPVRSAFMTRKQPPLSPQNGQTRFRRLICRIRWLCIREALMCLEQKASRFICFS